MSETGTSCEVQLWSCVHIMCAYNYNTILAIRSVPSVAHDIISSSHEGQDSLAVDI